MTKAQNAIVGRWRIVEADLWDRTHLDLCGPASLIAGADGHGEIAFGAMLVGLDIAYGAVDIYFTWQGFNEMDEVQGDGSAEIQKDGSISIDFAYHNGDDPVLKAARDPSSAACWRYVELESHLSDTITYKHCAAWSVRPAPYKQLT